MNTTLKYIIYCRRSQDREDKQTLSVESQKRELLAYAQKHNLHIVEIIKENASAYKRGRVQFNRMMEMIESGEANAVLTWHLTRLARSGADGGLIISFIDERKIIELRTPEEIYRNTSDNKFMMMIHFAMAKKSSDDTSSFVKNNVKTKLEKGEYPGVAPYGYINVGANGVIAGKNFSNEKQLRLETLNRKLNRIELDPIEAPLIRRLIDLALTGTYSTLMLQDEAMKLGIRGKLSKKGLAVQSILNILTNPFYASRFEWAGEMYRGSHEPLISSKEFEKLQEILFNRGRPKNTKRLYTYSALIHCPLCQSRMSGDYQKKIYYYRCTQAKGKYATCSFKKHIPQSHFDKEIDATLLRLKIPQKIIDWGLRALKETYIQELDVISSQQSSLERNIQNEKQKLQRLTSKWLSPENADGSLFSDEEYKSAKVDIIESLAKLEEQRSDKQGEETNWLDKCERFFMKVRNLPQEFNDSEVAEKRQKLQDIGAVFIRKDEKWLIQLDEPFSYVLEPEQIPESIRTAKISFPKPTFNIESKELSQWQALRESNPR